MINNITAGPSERYSRPSRPPSNANGMICPNDERIPTNSSRSTRPVSTTYESTSSEPEIRTNTSATEMSPTIAVGMTSRAWVGRCSKTVPAAEHREPGDAGVEGEPRPRRLRQVGDVERAQHPDEDAAGERVRVHEDDDRGHLDHERGRHVDAVRERDPAVRAEDHDQAERDRGRRRAEDPPGSPGRPSPPRPRRRARPCTRRALSGRGGVRSSVYISRQKWEVRVRGGKAAGRIEGP